MLVTFFALEICRLHYTERTGKKMCGNEYSTYMLTFIRCNACQRSMYTSICQKHRNCSQMFLSAIKSGVKFLEWGLRASAGRQLELHSCAHVTCHMPHFPHLPFAPSQYGVHFNYKKLPTLPLPVNDHVVMNTIFRLLIRILYWSIPVTLWLVNTLHL